MSLLEFDPPDRFVAGTVGPPGQRVFFLQARGGRRIVSVSLEKQQVRLLGERITELVSRLPDSAAIEAVAGALVDNEPLDTPIEDEFRVDTLALTWDAERGRVVVEAHDRDPEEVADDVAPDRLGTPVPDPAGATAPVLRVVIHPSQALSFARRCLAVVAAGRPACPFCALPLDPEGHICPRANGYRR